MGVGIEPGEFDLAEDGAYKLCLLGPVALEQSGRALELPKSRKARALLVYLALNSKPQRRELLANVFWEGAKDPRAELRWALSKLKSVLSDAFIVEGERIGLAREMVGIDICQLPSDLKGLNLAQLIELNLDLSFAQLSEFDLEKAYVYQLWLESERSRLRQFRLQVLQAICSELTDKNPMLELYARQYLALEPFAYELILKLLRCLLLHRGRKAARQEFERLRSFCAGQGGDIVKLDALWLGLEKVEDGEPQEQRQDLRAIELEPTIIAPDISVHETAKPSLALLGFSSSGDEPAAVLAKGLASDLASKLSHLKSLEVISTASSLRFLGSDLSPAHLGKLLNADYLLSGELCCYAAEISLQVNLVHAQSGRLVWSDSYGLDCCEFFTALDELVSMVVSRLEPELGACEYEKLKSYALGDLNAWQLYHVGLWHAFRFEPQHLAMAQAYLSRALSLEPDFARAHAGMSLIHFEQAFLALEKSEANAKQKASLRSPAVSAAMSSAKQAICCDGQDYFAYWSLARTLFLSSEHKSALLGIERALDLNSSFAQGYYTKGFIQVHANEPEKALQQLARAQRLSPFDPLKFAMVASRALALMSLVQYREAADVAVAATLEPNAHFHIYAIAAAALSLAGRDAEARRYMAEAKKQHLNYRQRDFFQAFPNSSQAQIERLSWALGTAGLPP
ncbi:hypothetical protein [Agaribacterium haliotis]|uniref:hypothetical protein n=1 Tax=Agaribacterium haliotis TaxID=2013869 RepID=UPI000BB585BE|nr:hypothetical protein [Agaribacterium haliotis]